MLLKVLNFKIKQNVDAYYFVWLNVLCFSELIAKHKQEQRAKIQKSHFRSSSFKLGKNARYFVIASLTVPKSMITNIYI